MQGSVSNRTAALIALVTGTLSALIASTFIYLFGAISNVILPEPDCFEKFESSISLESPPKFRILVFGLENDAENTQQTHIVRSLSNYFSQSGQVASVYAARTGDTPCVISVTGGENQQKISEAHHFSRQFIQRHYIDLAIWGRVISKDEIVELFFTPRLMGENAQGDFLFDNSLVLEESFDENLSQLITAHALILAEPDIVKEGGADENSTLSTIATLETMVPTARTMRQTPNVAAIIYYIARLKLIVAEKNADLRLAEQSKTYFSEAAEIFSLIGDSLGEARALNVMAYADLLVGIYRGVEHDATDVIVTFKKVLDILKNQDDQYLTGIVNNNLGLAYLNLAARGENAQLFEESESAFVRAGTILNEEAYPIEYAVLAANASGGKVRRALSEDRVNFQEIESALETLEQSAVVLERAGANYLAGKVRNNLCVGQIEFGAMESRVFIFEQAIRNCERALSYWQSPQYRSHRALAFGNIGRAQYTMGAIANDVILIRRGEASIDFALSELVPLDANKDIRIAFSINRAIAVYYRGLISEDRLAIRSAYCAFADIKPHIALNSTLNLRLVDGHMERISRSPFSEMATAPCP